MSNAPVRQTGVCSYIQYGESLLFFKKEKSLRGYMIIGIFIAPNVDAKVDFAQLWKYFLKFIVKNNDMYCSLFLDGLTDFFPGHIHYHSELNGLSIFKIDNFLKEKYSKYFKKDTG